MDKNVNRHSQQRMTDIPRKRGSLMFREMQISNTTQQFTPTVRETAPNFPFSIATPLGEMSINASTLENNLALSDTAEMQVSWIWARPILAVFPEAVLQVGSLDGLNTEELYSHLTQPEHSCAQSMSSGRQGGHLWLHLATSHIAHPHPSTGRKELLPQRYFWKRCPRDTPAYVHHEACLRTLPEACLQRRK